MRTVSVETDRQKSSCVWFYRQQLLGNPDPSRRPIDRHGEDGGRRDGSWEAYGGKNDKVL